MIHAVRLECVLQLLGVTIYGWLGDRSILVAADGLELLRDLVYDLFVGHFLAPLLVHTA